MSATPPSGYAYIRHSTKRQGGDDKDSVTRQKESIRLLAEQYKVELPDDNFFYENGVSAFSGKNRTHGKLKELIDQIDSLRIRPGDYVFVESIDRLSRQRLLQAKELVNGILEKGIILVTTIDNQRYEKASEANGIDDLAQDILLSVIAKRAHEESRTKSVRRLSAWNKAKKEADEKRKPFNVKRPPFGVQYNDLTQNFEPHPEQAEELTRIFESLKLQGVTATIKEINKNSLVRWTSNRVKDIFETKYPLGFMYSQKKVDGKMQFDKYIENYYPQLVSYELFEEARQAMQQRKIKKRVGRASVGNVNIFRHTARCGQCGESMFFMHNFGSGKKHYYYLSCRSNFEQNVKCNNRIRYDFAVQILFVAIQHAELLSWLSEQTDEDKKQFGDYLYKSFKDLDEIGISNGMLTLATAFLKIMSTSSEHKAYNTEIIQIEGELSKAKIRLENLERSAESIIDGNYPSILLKQLASAEESISSLKEKREQYITNASTQKSDLKIETLKQFTNLFREETGRLEIINFLVSNGLTFSFDYDKQSKKMTTTVHIDNKLISTLYSINDNTYLSEFGFKNLGDEFKLFD
jgi:DNA invertase Pin-like site-specific DNA recombinase